ncbi:MAG: cytochrome C oxidase subunit IV family protein [Candidatus Eisenbacteria bacterium]|uniref:Cytochrome C oxidase subunit IV family protein n=1 Tax=Eiseniibacteriota bacterium TaxID=2212470 RepID=A0A849SFW1_UNCEI|nr:cytochrome C oxidase subunit IV family protein [Candidatus Eisenbacteria bacterium]
MSAHAKTHDEGHAPGAGHHRNYVKIWAILLVLLIVSVTGPMLGIRVITLITAFGIALVKAYIVAKNFMHLDVEKPIVHWALAVALLLMVVFYAGIAPDVQKQSGTHWKKAKVESHAPAHGSGHEGH